MIKFVHKHVYLLGLHDPVLLREMLATHLVQVDLHDCDEYVAPEDEKDAKFSVGQAKFTFKDLLRPNCKEVKLRSDVFPTKRELQDNTQILDLNTTAKKGERGVEKFSPYLIHATYAVLTAEIAYPIGSFNEEAELKKLKPVEEQVPDSRGSQRALASDFDEGSAIFERMVIIIPYKAPETVAQIERSFERINMEKLNFDNVRYLNTKEFSEEERRNRRLDFLGGVELIDSENRVYIFEGLGGEGRAMN